MGRTNKERILNYLWSIAPDYATNNQIREATGIRSHQQVYLLTQELMRSGLVRGERRGRKVDLLDGRIPRRSTGLAGASIAKRADYSPRLKAGGSDDPAVFLKLSPALPEATEGTTS